MRSRGTDITIEIASLGVLAFLWGSSYLLMKLALASIPPITLIAARVAIAAGFLLLALRIQGNRLPREARWWRMFLVQAFLNSIGAWTVLAWGQLHVDSALAGVLNSTSPIFVFLITWLFLRRDEATDWKLAGALMGLAGVILIVGMDALAGLGRNIVAQLAVLSGAVMYAGAAIYGRRFAALPPTVTAAGTMLWASLFLLPASLLLDQPWTLAPTWNSLLAAAGLGVFCTGIALLLYFRLVRTLGSFGVASQSYLRAGISVVLGVLVLGERITPTIALGLAMTILGVAALNLPPRRRTRQA